MQKKNNKGVIALIIVLVLAAAALVIWQTNKRETQQGGKEITVNVDHLNGDDMTFTIRTDEEYLRGALEQEDLIEGTESEYGLYVLTVDGETKFACVDGPDFDGHKVDFDETIRRSRMYSQQEAAAREKHACRMEGMNNGK